MGVVTWLNRTLGRDLDRDVHGASGTAQVRYPGPLGDARLVARARLSEGARGPLILRARPADPDEPPQTREGRSSIEVDLGPGRDFAGTELRVEAQVNEALDRKALVALVVEVLEIEAGAAGAAPSARESYSVESRLDDGGHARLELRVQLG